MIILSQTFSELFGGRGQGVSALASGIALSSEANLHTTLDSSWYVYSYLPRNSLFTTATAM